MGRFLIHSAALRPLIGAFSQFKLKIIIDRYIFIAILAVDFVLLLSSFDLLWFPLVFYLGSFLFSL